MSKRDIEDLLEDIIEQSQVGNFEIYLGFTAEQIQYGISEIRKALKEYLWQQNH